MSDYNFEKPTVTGKLDAEQREAVVIPGLGGFGSRFPTRDMIYHPVPYNYSTIQNPTAWRIQVKFGAPAPRLVVGLDIYGDTILGRGAHGPQSPDVDLSNLNALELGVSRRHALLRPTYTQLFVIDLESTNGTYVNAIPVGRGMARVIRTNDTIALAGLNFVVEIISSPKNYPPGIATKPLVQPGGTEEEEDEQAPLQLGMEPEEPPSLALGGPLPPISPSMDADETLIPGEIPPFDRVDYEPPLDEEEL